MLRAAPQALLPALPTSAPQTRWAMGLPPNIGQGCGTDDFGVVTLECCGASKMQVPAKPNQTEQFSSGQPLGARLYFFPFEALQ